MTVLFLITTYVVIASASIFGLIVSARKADALCYDPDFFDLAGYFFCGLLWPLCLLPCLAYIGAKWYINSKEEE